MKSKVKLLGHPIHPMLVVFPVGLFVTAVIFDVIHLTTNEPVFATVSYYLIAAGILGGLLAAIFGTIDWLSLPINSRAWNLGIWHGIGNVMVVALFMLSWLSRREHPNFLPETSAIALAFAGIGLALVTTWIGGELVYRLGIGVDPEANVNAPNSINNPSPDNSRARTASHR